MKKLVVIGLLGLFGFTACGSQPAPQAQNSDVNALENLELSVEEVPTPKEVLSQLELAKSLGQSNAKDSYEAIDLVMIGTIINLGKEVWQIVDQNKPVSDIKYDYATAVPQGINDILGQMEGFSDLQSKSYRISFKTRLGTESVGGTYTLVHQYGGNYKGKGKYLSTVGIIPSQFNVGYGVKANFAVNKVSTVNVGTEADPIASLTMEMKLSTRSVFKARDNTVIVNFRGDQVKPKVINNGGI